MSGLLKCRRTQADAELIVSEKRKVGSTRVDKDSLVDLMGDENPSTNGAPTPTSALDNLGSAQNTQDLLADIFGSSSSDPTPSTQLSSQPKPQNAVNDIMNLFGSTSISPNPTGPAMAPVASSPLDMLSSMGSSASSPQPPVSATTTMIGSSAAPPPPKQQLQAYTAYEKNGLKITLTPKVNPAHSGMVQILARFTALDQTGVKNVNFQAAVPKVITYNTLFFDAIMLTYNLPQTQQLQMLAMSNGDVTPGATETQQMRVIAPPGAQVRLRLRISYSKSDSGEAIQEQVDFSGFPAGLTLGQM